MVNDKKDFIPFSRPDISNDEINNVCEVLKSGWLTTGPVVKRFEEEFKSFIKKDGNLYAIAVNSATSGLHLALEALGIKSGDEVITTTLTFTATAEVVRYLGAEVKFVDINPETMNIDVRKIEDSITDNTKAIIPVHYAGLSCEMDEILALAKKYNLKVIEDAAHALPTTYKGELIGNLSSDATVFSFYANKTMTTGEGGMIVTNNKSIAERIKTMRLHGIDRDAFDRFQSKSASWYYEVIAPGFKYNLTDIAAAIGIAQLKRMPNFVIKRQELANNYLKELHTLPLILPQNPTDRDAHAWHLFVIRLADNVKITRDELIAFMLEEGIGASVHYVPLHLQPYWKKRYKLESSQFKEAQKAYSKMVSIPLFSSMTIEEQNKVIETLKKVEY